MEPFVTKVFIELYDPSNSRSIINASKIQVVSILYDTVSFTKKKLQRVILNSLLCNVIKWSDTL